MRLRTCAIAVVGVLAGTVTAQAREMSRAQYSLFAGSDLTSSEAHLSIISNPKDPAGLIVISAGKTGGLLSVSRFICATLTEPEAYWTTAVPFTTKAAQAPVGLKSTALIPRDQSVRVIELVLGCRPASVKS